MGSPSWVQAEPRRLAAGARRGPRTKVCLGMSTGADKDQTKANPPANRRLRAPGRSGIRARSPLHLDGSKAGKWHSPSTAFRVSGLGPRRGTLTNLQAPVCRHPGGGPPPEQSRVPPPTGSWGFTKLRPQLGAPTPFKPRGGSATRSRRTRGPTAVGISASTQRRRRQRGTKTSPSPLREAHSPAPWPPCPTLWVTLGASLPLSLSFPDYATNRAQQAAARPSSRHPGRGLPTSVEPAEPGSCNHADGGAGGRVRLAVPRKARRRGLSEVGRAKAAPGPRFQGFRRPRGRLNPVPARPWLAAPSPRGLALPGLL